MKTARKLSRKSFPVWLKELVDSGEAEGVRWLDPDRRTFRIPWTRVDSPNFDIAKDAVVFQRWAEFTGRFRCGERPDPSVWKTRFRCAIRKMTEIKEVTVKNSLDEKVEKQPYRIFQFHKEGRSTKQRKSPYCASHSAVDLPEPVKVPANCHGNNGQSQLHYATSQRIMKTHSNSSGYNTVYSTDTTGISFYTTQQSRWDTAHDGNRVLPAGTFDTFPTYYPSCDYGQDSGGALNTKLSFSSQSQYECSSLPSSSITGEDYILRSRDPFSTTPSHLPRISVDDVESVLTTDEALDCQGGYAALLQNSMDDVYLQSMIKFSAGCLPLSNARQVQTAECNLGHEMQEYNFGRESTLTDFSERPFVRNEFLISSSPSKGIDACRLEEDVDIPSYLL